VVQEIERVGISVGEEAGEDSLGHEGEVADVFLGPGRANAGKCLLVGSTEDVEDLVELIDVISAFEKWASTEQFCENAAYGPDVD
jgi:hypothetical protein